MLRLEDFKIQAIGRYAQAQTWILWHPEQGAHILDASRRQNRKRHATLTTAQSSVQARGEVGAKIQILDDATVFSVPLPIDCPAKGKPLLDAAIEAIRAAIEPSPLEMRDGMNEQDLSKLLVAIEYLTRTTRNVVALPDLLCNQDPKVPIEESERKKLLPLGPTDWLTAVLEDVSRAFGLRSTIRKSPRAPLNRSGEYCAFLKSDFQRLENPTAHEEMEAIATVTDFYARMQGPLGLDANDLAYRFKILKGMGDGASQ
jgi:hypothetical protein